MKKVFAVLAVLAVAAAAQADLVKTWTASGSAEKYTDGTAANQDQITFHDLVPSGRYDSTSVRMNNLADGGVLTGTAAATWEFTLNDGYTFSLDSIQGQLSTAGAGGVHQFKWTASRGDVTETKGFDTAGSYQTVTWDANGSQSWTASGANLTETLSLMPTSGQNINGGNVGTQNRTDMKQLDVFGSVTAGGPAPAVPEPATMSLLGLGALAMALRRKLRK